MLVVNSQNDGTLYQMVLHIRRLLLKNLAVEQLC